MAPRYHECSDLYCDIANDEGVRVCEEFAEDGELPSEIYAAHCEEEEEVEGVPWPEYGTEAEIRSASRAEWIRRLQPRSAPRYGAD